MAVRLRKEMYLDSKNHAAEEIITNAVDEFLAGRCTYITFHISKEEWVTVLDNGGGIPITKHPKYPELTQAEVAYTVLHAGGKFGISEGSYKSVTGGLHGVGASVVNATSDMLYLNVYQEGKIYEAEFSKGQIIKNMHYVETLEETFTGTRVCYHLDDEVWGDEKYDFKKLKKKLQQLSYLNSGLTIDYENEITNEKETFCHTEGIKDYVAKLIEFKTPLGEIYHMAQTNELFTIQCALSYTDTYHEETYTFCNNINTEGGGDHLIGFHQGLLKALNEYALTTKTLKDNQKFELSDCTEGLVSIVAIFVTTPKFEGQSKSKIKMTNLRTPIKNYVSEQIYQFLDSHPTTAKLIIEKILIAKEARLKAQLAKTTVRKSKSLIQGNTKKLAQCTEKDPAKCEIYIVEGDSAGGSVKAGRNRKTQAVLPLFGKIANVERMNFDTMLESTKIQDLVRSLGCGIGKDFNIEKLRYHKIIILADADVDGYHIATLYLTFFYRYYFTLIEMGYIYIGVAPLYKITVNKRLHYAYTDEEKDAYLQTLENKKYDVQRYKGLGEMNAEQLWETVLNPENRKLIRITIEDAEEAEKMLITCMGKDVALRKKFIEENANYAEIQ